MPAGAKEVQVVLTFKDDGSYDLKKVVKEINDTLNQAGVSAKVAGQGFEKMNEKVRQADSGFQKLKGSFKSGMLQMAAGLGIWTGMSSAISFFTRTIRDTIVQGKAFEEAFTRIRVVTRGNVEENNKLRDTLIRMSPALGSATEMTRALSVAMREFKEVTRGEQIKFVETAAKVAVAGFTSVETALESLSTVVKSYRMNLSDAVKVGEVLVRATQIEAVTFEEVSRGLGRLSNTAKLAGVSFAELVGSYLTLAERQTPQLALMQLNMLLTGLMKASGPAVTEAKRLGIEWSAAGVKAMGFVNWLKKLNQVTAGSAEVLDNLIPGGRQMIGMLSLVGNNAKETAAKVSELNKAWDEGGAIQAAFNERLHSTSFLLDTAKEIFNRFKIALFQGFSAPLLEGINKQKDFEKRLQEVTNRAVTFGIKVGKAIYDLVVKIEKLSATLKLFGQVWITFFVINKVTDWTNALISGLTLSSSVLKGAKLAALGLAGALQLVTQVLGTFIAGYKIGQWLSDITGLTRAAVKTGAWGVGPDDIAQLKAMTKLRDLTKNTTASAVELGAMFSGDYVQALRTVEQGYIKLYPKQKTSADIMKESIAYSTALATATSSVVLSEEELETAIEGLTAEQQAHIIALNRAKEEMKKYGFTFKTELIDRYKALELGLATFKKQMTPEDYSKLRAELKRLGADLGYVNKALVELNILTKTETSVEVIKVTTRFWQLKQAADAGLITWKQYLGGVDQINASLKNLDPTLTATYKGITKLVETPLPAPKTMPGVAPGITPFEISPMLSADEMKKALASLGPSFALLRQWEIALGVPIKTLAGIELPGLTAAFKYAMSHNLIATTNLGQAAETLIAHFKNAGEEVPKWLQKIADKAKKASESIKNDMASAFSTLATSLQVFGDSAPERFQGMVNAAAVAADQISQALSEGLNLGEAIAKVGPVLAGQLGSGIAQAITGNKSKLAGIGSALGGVIGGFFGPIGKLVGSFVGGLLGGLFGGKSKEQKAAELLASQIKSITTRYKEFGKITEETAKKINDMTKAINSQTAAILTLGDVMNDVGISSKNLSAYLQKMKQALADIKNGSVDAQKGIDAIGQAFNSLITWAQKFGQEGSKALVAFIQYLRKLGVSVKEIDDYVFSQLGRAAYGLKAMTSAVGGKAYTDLVAYKDQITNLTEEVQNLQKSRLDTREQQADFQRKKAQLIELQSQYEIMKGTLADELGAELARISNLTVATFNAILAQGGSMTEAFAAVKDPLDTLREKYETLGITGGAAIQELLKLSEVAAANQGLFEALDGNRQVLEALGNTGFLTADALKDTATQTQAYYDQLLGTGLNANQALAMISPTLADMEYYAKQYGITLDDNTKMLIMQSKMAGTFKERGKDVVTTLNEGFDSIATRLDRMIEQGERGRVGERGGGRGETTYAQAGFSGTVTGPRMFYIEPGVTENVQIGKGSNQASMTVIERPITIKPVVIPLKELKSIFIEWVQEESDDERLLIRPRSVR